MDKCSVHAGRRRSGNLCVGQEHRLGGLRRDEERREGEAVSEILRGEPDLADMAVEGLFSRCGVQDERAVQSFARRQDMETEKGVWLPLPEFCLATGRKSKIRK